MKTCCFHDQLLVTYDWYQHFWCCGISLLEILHSGKNNIQLMTSNEVDTRIYQPKNIIFTEARGRSKYIYSWVNKSWYSSNWKSLIFIIWHILYVSSTLKISIYHNVFFGLAWWKMSREVNKCYIHLEWRHVRWI